MCFLFVCFYAAELGEKAGRPGLRDSTFSFLSVKIFLNSLVVVEDYEKVIGTPNPGGLLNMSGLLVALKMLG